MGGILDSAAVEDGSCIEGVAEGPRGGELYRSEIELGGCTKLVVELFSRCRYLLMLIIDVQSLYGAAHGYFVVVIESFGEVEGLFGQGRAWGSGKSRARARASSSFREARSSYSKLQQPRPGRTSVPIWPEGMNEKRTVETPYISKLWELQRLQACNSWTGQSL